MPKYYVRSNELERIVIASTPMEAAKLSIRTANGEEVGDRFYVDERGFRGPQPHKNIFGVMADAIPEDSFALNEVIPGV